MSFLGKMSDNVNLTEFENRILKTDNCWIWLGNIAPIGYGRYFKNGKSFYVHRISYELFKKPIKKGYHIDHLCKNRKCVNPDHLEEVTLSENVKRGTAYDKKRNQTYCLRGHLFSKENTKINSQKARICKKCQRIRQKSGLGKMTYNCYYQSMEILWAT